MNTSLNPVISGFPTSLFLPWMHLIWGDCVPEPRGVVEGHRRRPQVGWCWSPESSVPSWSHWVGHVAVSPRVLCPPQSKFSPPPFLPALRGRGNFGVQPKSTQDSDRSGTICLHLACRHFRPFAEPFGVQDYLELTPRIWSHVGKGKVFSLSSLLSPDILPFIPPGAGAFALSRDPQQSLTS